jgi:hypothetical protein
MYCYWNAGINLLAISQGVSNEFEVSLDVRDYRPMAWAHRAFTPVAYVNIRITYDPTKLEFLDLEGGIDIDETGWWINYYVEPWYENPSLNLIHLTMRTRSFNDPNYWLDYPILPPVYLPQFNDSYYHFRLLNLTFRQIANSGETRIHPIYLNYDVRSSSNMGVLDPLYLRLSPTPPRVRNGTIG